MPEPDLTWWLIRLTWAAVGFVGGCIVWDGCRDALDRWQCRDCRRLGGPVGPR